MDSTHQHGLAPLAREHLLLKLRGTNRALASAVERQSAAVARVPRPDLAALCVTDEQAIQLLDELSGDAQTPLEAPGAMPREEEERERELRRAAADRLPLDVLSRMLGLSAFEEQALLLCAAVEVDRRYERVFAYVLDDLDRRQPCVELLCALGAGDTCTALASRAEAGRFGRLRRAGLLLPVGESRTELRQELRIAPALLEWLLLGRGDPASFVDPAEVPAPVTDELPPGVDAERADHLAQAVADGQVSIAGVFGPRGAPHDGCVRALAARVERPLRRLWADSPATLADGLAAGAALGALLWLESDVLTEPGNERLRQAIAARLAASRVPLLLSGVHPWRPAQLLAARSYAEIELLPPDWSARRSMWAAALPDAEAPRHQDLALRFRMSELEMRAVARAARAAARVGGNGTPLPVDGQLDEACAAVARRRSDHFATLVKPRRGPDDLVLAPDLHRQVLEIARFFRALPRVTESWHLDPGSAVPGGLKALFAGDSGTGKTLAAEVVASQLGLPLLKIDLARVVSKWVGESEKNLETAFREAEESNSILFFDEADALFGKRGEVSHGTDRYANLEVSYLLQRLEEHPGLVILATNLRDQIDEAFVRRFHVILHFPRPSLDERARIWRMALPRHLPLAGDVDLATLGRLDLTGAGIVGTARTAALLAADEDADSVGMRHLVWAARRQFQREARLLTSADLGRYAHLLPGA